MKRIKSEKGAVPVIEAALMFPITFFVVFLLLYMSLYVYQNVVMYNQAQKIATIASKELSMPGYEVIGGTAAKTNQVDFEKESDFTGKISQIFDERNGLYRYFDFGDPLERASDSGDIKGTLEDELTKLVTNTNFLSASDDVIECEINAQNYFITQKVSVTVSKKVEIPEFFSHLGIDGSRYDITVTATAASSDGAEFVRNTDMVYDFITFLSDKLKISEKIEGITQKIRDTCNNIK